MTLYDLLGITQKATDDEINKAFRKKAHLLHPDKGGSESDFKKINEARETLLNNEKRKRYDAQLGIKSGKIGVSVSTGKNGETVTFTVDFW